MHWGHFTSEDLVNWKEEIIPLRPEEGFASFGVWSGTTFFDQNSKPVIAYTGVNGAKAAIGLSYPLDDDLLNWTTQATKSIITGAPINIPNKDFRDPYVWKEGDKYYMVVGSGVANNGGGMLASYTSTDLVSWTNIVPIYKNNNINSAGVFWEMPFFNKINDKDYLLVVTPIYNGAPARCIYWLGSFDGTEFKPYDNNPKEFEHIAGRLLSPSIGIDADNKFTYIGIIPEDRNVQDQVKAGWRQTFSIPRIMESTGSKLVHRPHPNLCKARANEVSIHNKIVQHSTSNNLPEYKGNQSEMEFYLNTKIQISLLSKYIKMMHRMNSQASSSIGTPKR
ncbi:MAG: glycoside hydrolase family 32 protein [Saprospiraceae bacterium]|nr:glycoside hydrolase family 32 protein [Saprospiraceae bacterium]